MKKLLILLLFIPLFSFGQTEDELVQYGNSKFNDKKFDEAILLYDKALSVNPNSKESLVNRGLAKSMKGFYYASIKDFDKAIELDDKFVLAYYNRANTRLERSGPDTPKSLYDKMILDLNKVIEIDNKYVKAYINRGIILSRLGYESKNILESNTVFNSALNDFNTALELLDKSVFSSTLFLAYANRGSVWLFLENIEEACNDWNNAKSISQNYLDNPEVIKQIYKIEELIEIKCN